METFTKKKYKDTRISVTTVSYTHLVMGELMGIRPIITLIDGALLAQIHHGGHDFFIAAHLGLYLGFAVDQGNDCLLYTSDSSRFRGTHLV